MKNRIRRNLNEANAFLNEYTPPLVYPDFLNNNFSQLMLDEREMTMKRKGESNLEGKLTSLSAFLLERYLNLWNERCWKMDGKIINTPYLPNLKSTSLVRKA